MGKLTTSMAIFNSELLVYQRVDHENGDYLEIIYDFLVVYTTLYHLEVCATSPRMMGPS